MFMFLFETDQMCILKSLTILFANAKHKTLGG